MPYPCDSNWHQLRRSPTLGDGFRASGGDAGSAARPRINFAALRARAREDVRYAPSLRPGDLVAGCFTNGGPTLKPLPLSPYLSWPWLLVANLWKAGAIFVALRSVDQARSEGSTPAKAEAEAPSELNGVGV
jgi:hypothetical protein